MMKPSALRILKGLLLFAAAQVVLINGVLITPLVLSQGRLHDLSGLAALSLVGAYGCSLAVIVALCLVYRIVGLIQQGRVFESASVAALRGIAVCGLVIDGLFLLGALVLLFQGLLLPGIVLIGLGFVTVSTLVIALCLVLAGLLAQAIGYREEAALTV